ncbi:hypothetical protein GCM10008107_10240 [Psychrosphaera saromensis]|uniref:Spore coat protein U domain-containing protein n=1 Tax=Psychrosphaera saromensis TaxID=716813 RepID=A0A2S7UUN0_9GAMM|nr:hypothetical protein [Psychrosphaera saromensis]PQJ53696.1 hypothetical protein BTO11_08470 [Psychrosphaera saromensis]GHB63092.1 hypothetical protein GCM10008107_10240 [Psychrosphaera saromensis]GLQ15527.1 hypothetical protein GCM10007917_29820 [Psychrosphaera saromensis]
MKKNIISKALAGSVLVAASMSANAATTPVTVAFAVLPALIISPIENFDPGAVLTGTAGSTCVWTPTFLNDVNGVVGPSGETGTANDVNVVRNGGGCPTQPIAAGTTATTGVYTIDGGTTAVNVDINIELQAGAATTISWDPIGIATPNDISYPSVQIPTGTPTTVNTGGNGLVVLYLGGTSTIISPTDIITGENVSFDIVALY